MESKDEQDDELGKIEYFKESKKPDYIIKGDYRFVKNYDFEFHTFTKGRWLNQNIYQTFIKEFRAYDELYYKKAIQNGRITVNGNKVGLDYVLKNNDKILHKAERRERPIYNFNIEIIYEDDDLFIINKPPSVPVHVCGAYFYNTILGILKFVYGMDELHTLHRLDKLTSGILMLSKRHDLALKFHEDLKKNELHKIYLARVVGNFPEEEVIVEKPIYCVSHKLGKYDTCEPEDNKGKYCKTIFNKQWYDPESNTSLVQCLPYTGRTHQIRLHLKYLGHSIVNDVNYGGRFLGNLYPEFTQSQEKEQIEPKVIKKIKTESLISLQEEEIQEYIVPHDYVYEIWLHALSYKFNEKIYQTQEPYWANKSIKLPKFKENHNIKEI